jgi:AcrR family transcriptional regulator
MPRPRTQTDFAILVSARSVLLAEGPGAPLRAIARRAGLTAPALLARFGTREALVRQALAVPPVAPALSLMLADPDRDRIGEQLAAILAALASWYREAAPRLMVVRGLEPLRGSCGPGPEGDDAPRLHHALAIWLARAQAVSAVVQGDPLVLAGVALAAVAGRACARLLMRDPDPVTDAQVEAAVARLLLSPSPAIRAPGAGTAASSAGAPAGSS